MGLSSSFLYRPFTLRAYGAVEVFDEYKDDFTGGRPVLWPDMRGPRTAPVMIQPLAQTNTDTNDSQDPAI